MRSDQIIGAALLILALGAADAAEARARGARGGVRSATIGSAAVIATGSLSTAFPEARPGPEARPFPEARPGPETADPATPPVKPVAAPTPPAREVRAAAPWCASRRVVGTGIGFCVIN